jgi:hypothetical protein
VIPQPSIQFDRSTGVSVLGQIKVSSDAGNDVFGTAFCRMQ